MFAASRFKRDWRDSIWFADRPKACFTFLFPFQDTAGTDESFTAFPLGEFFGINQIQKIEFQEKEDDIGNFRRKASLTLQDIVYVRLGDASETGQPSFREFATVYAIAEVRDQAEMEFLEIHLPAAYFCEK